ncbi:hypothetical protein K470DRAFT_282838 [Piedraia hortae CBS 480.64]|uniref:Cytochrome c oxidase assembly factor 3 n=1 Tax=Piedraia hortae CBS 480.64 TaxID=1314780 RepID=A0A6A7BVW1_9PEZI|nr:hypothetical protein K470DRAFT_282838 [Piedraia hortae CBS 480.64]
MPFDSLPEASYYDARNRQGASLIRARQPYLIKNAVTGLTLAGFGLAVFMYTIRVIGQDDFSDVPIPDAPVNPPQTPNASVVKSAGPSR